MASLQLSAEDLELHVVKIGLDIFPPLSIADERTRLNLFAAEARQSLSHLYDKVVESSKEFSMSGIFRPEGREGSTAAEVPTFVMTKRGPVFIFPLRLPVIGATGITEEELLLDFDKVRKILFSSFPGMQCIRIGLVRELGFHTGSAPCTELLKGEPSFAEAKLIGGNRLIHYRDDKCNVRISIEPGVVSRKTTLAVGKTVTESDGFGLQVTLDVNNHDLHVLTDAERDEILERACSFWPDTLVDYLNAMSTQ